MLPAYAGGYYETSEPKDSHQETPGYFPDSVVAALCLSTSTRPWAFTPHTFYMSLMKVASVLCVKWWPIATESEFPGTECHGSLYFSPDA